MTDNVVRQRHKECETRGRKEGRKRKSERDGEETTLRRRDETRRGVTNSEGIPVPLRDSRPGPSRKSPSPTKMKRPFRFPLPLCPPFAPLPPLTQPPGFYSSYHYSLCRVRYTRRGSTTPIVSGCARASLISSICSSQERPQSGATLLRHGETPKDSRMRLLHVRDRFLRPLLSLPTERLGICFRIVQLDQPGGSGDGQMIDSDAASRER